MLARGHRVTFTSALQKRVQPQGQAETVLGHIGAAASGSLDWLDARLENKHIRNQMAWAYLQWERRFGFNGEAERWRAFALWWACAASHWYSRQAQHRAHPREGHCKK